MANNPFEAIREAEERALANLGPLGKIQAVAAAQQQQAPTQQNPPTTGGSTGYEVPDVSYDRIFEAYRDPSKVATLNQFEQRLLKELPTRESYGEGFTPSAFTDETGYVSYNLPVGFKLAPRNNDPFSREEDQGQQFTFGYDSPEEIQAALRGSRGNQWWSSNPTIEQAGGLSQLNSLIAANQYGGKLPTEGVRAISFDDYTAATKGLTPLAKGDSGRGFMYNPQTGKAYMPGSMGKYSGQRYLPSYFEVPMEYVQGILAKDPKYVIGYNPETGAIEGDVANVGFLGIEPLGHALKAVNKAAPWADDALMAAAVISGNPLAIAGATLAKQGTANAEDYARQQDDPLRNQRAGGFDLGPVFENVALSSMPGIGGWQGQVFNAGARYVQTGELNPAHLLMDITGLSKAQPVLASAVAQYVDNDGKVDWARVATSQLARTNPQIAEAANIALAASRGNTAGALTQLARMGYNAYKNP